MRVFIVDIEYIKFVLFENDFNNTGKFINFLATRLYNKLEKFKDIELYLIIVSLE